MTDVTALMTDVGRRAKAAARQLSVASTDAKNRALAGRGLGFGELVAETYDRVHAYSLLLEAGFDRASLGLLATSLRSTEECVAAADAWLAAAPRIQRAVRVWRAGVQHSREGKVAAVPGTEGAKSAEKRED